MSSQSHPLGSVLRVLAGALAGSCNPQDLPGIATSPAHARETLKRVAGDLSTVSSTRPELAHLVTRVRDGLQLLSTDLPEAERDQTFRVLTANVCELGAAAATASTESGTSELCAMLVPREEAAHALGVSVKRLENWISSLDRDPEWVIRDGAGPWLISRPVFKAWLAREVKKRPGRPPKRRRGR